jgi:hypothetical protein
MAQALRNGRTSRGALERLLQTQAETASSPPNVEATVATTLETQSASNQGVPRWGRGPSERAHRTGHHQSFRRRRTIRRGRRSGLEHMSFDPTHHLAMGAGWG